MGLENTMTIGAMVISFGDGASSIIGDNSSVNVLSNGGQLLAAYVSPIPGATIAVAPAAATITFVKIVIDVGAGSNIGAGDILSIAGNVVGFIGAVGVLAGASGIAIPAAAIGIGLGALGALSNTPFGKDQLDAIRNAIFPNPDFNTLQIVDPGYVISGDPGNPFGISLSVNTSWANAINWRPAGRDPLAIDLDGDGIETVGISASPVLFDHDANGVKTGTGWLKGDDAWLVMDRDGNGTIDSGRELFGVDTQITLVQSITNPDGTTSQVSSTRTASSGFDALHSVDSNSDGIFNNLDAAYLQVRLWQDLNQDGVSQANELSTLAAKGIASISLTQNNASTNLGNGNTVTGTATVTRSDGSTTVVDSVGVSTDGAGNLALASNPFFREFTDVIPPTAAALALPEMGGSGWLRDLREAMSSGSIQATALQSAVQQFSSGVTRSTQVAAMDTLIQAWANTTNQPTSKTTTAGFLRSYGPVGGPVPQNEISAVEAFALASPQVYQAVNTLEQFNAQLI